MGKKFEHNLQDPTQDLSAVSSTSSVNYVSLFP